MAGTCSFIRRSSVQSPNVVDNIGGNSSDVQEQLAGGVQRVERGRAPGRVACPKPPLLHARSFVFLLLFFLKKTNYLIIKKKRKEKVAPPLSTDKRRRRRHPRRLGRCRQRRGRLWAAAAARRRPAWPRPWRVSNVGSGARRRPAELAVRAVARCFRLWPQITPRPNGGAAGRPAVGPSCGL